MNKVTINNEIELTYPDSFKEMNEAELTKYFSSPENRWGIFEPDSRILFSIGWAKAGAFADAEAMLDKMETRMRSSLLNYQRINVFDTKLGSKKARGLRFEYRVNDAAIVHIAEIIAFKHKKKLYATHFVTRKVQVGANNLVYKEIIDSINVL